MFCNKKFCHLKLSNHNTGWPNSTYIKYFRATTKFAISTHFDRTFSKCPLMAKLGEKKYQHLWFVRFGLISYNETWSLIQTQNHRVLCPSHLWVSCEYAQIALDNSTCLRSGKDFSAMLINIIFATTIVCFPFCNVLFQQHCFIFLSFPNRNFILHLCPQPPSITSPLHFMIYFLCTGIYIYLSKQLQQV